MHSTSAIKPGVTHRPGPRDVLPSPEASSPWLPKGLSTTSFAGTTTHVNAHFTSHADVVCPSGGTSGCVIAGRLAEDPDVSILVIEAGDHSDNVPATKMVGGIMTMFGGEHDWCFQDEGSPGLNGRKVVLGRGKYASAGGRLMHGWTS